MRPTDANGAPQVVIVGAGAAGLSAGGALKRLGIEPTILDKDDRIGGSWARRYERLHLHTVRRFSGLAHHPIPRSYPRYVPKDQFADYLEQYAEALQLHVELGSPVRTVRTGEDGLWEIVSEKEERRLAPVVIIATGNYHEPVVPRWPGLEDYGGRVVHSHDYASGRDFAGEDVLVVGIGNSGAEIAADLVEQGASRVAIAVRTSPPIMPRDLFGLVPVQMLGLALTPVPAPALIDRAGALTRRVATGDLSPYGLGKAEWGPFTARRPPVIDVGFLKELKRRKIEVLPSPERFKADGVVFADGRKESFAAVIAATGYDSGLRRLLDVPGALKHDGRPRFRSGRPTPHAGLYFIGFDETTRGVLFEAKRDSLRLARAVRRYLDTRATPT
jgi:cation diffusion facilitator CzcD-associated flavoprotein CzcO